MMKSLTKYCKIRQNDIGGMYCDTGNYENICPKKEMKGFLSRECIIEFEEPQCCEFLEENISIE